MFPYRFVFFFFLISTFPLQGQELGPCGTTDEKNEWLVKYQQNPGLFEKSDEILYVPITIHIVGTDEGTGYYSTKNLHYSLCKLNEDLFASGIHLFMEGEINYIDNSNYYDHNFGTGSQMMSNNNVSNTINCYIVENPADNCGYSNYSKGIALAKHCLGANSSTWAHEVGHYLSLPHPFKGWGNEDYRDIDSTTQYINGNLIEKVDGSNCSTAADGFCDTPPDYLSFRWTCNDDGESKIVQTDPDGTTFRSDGTLIMSYSNDGCATRFSEEQKEAMRANLQYQRSNLLYVTDPEPDISNPPVLNTPAPEETIQHSEAKLFEWEAVSGATDYFVEISRVPAFTIIFEQFTTSDTSALISGFQNNKTYFWRVKPFNKFSFCTDFSETGKFFTRELTSLEELQKYRSFSLFPNPVKSEETLWVKLEMKEKSSLNISILNTNGKQVNTFQTDALPGGNTFKISTANLLPGMYFISIERNTSHNIERFIVH